MDVQSPLEMTDYHKTLSLLLNDGDDSGSAFCNNNEICYDLMKANDRKGTPPSKRESRITSLFKKIGVQVTFVD